MVFSLVRKRNAHDTSRTCSVVIAVLKEMAIIPEYMLVEDLRYWKHLKVYYRPSQYQFLTDIQQRKRPIESWPENSLMTSSDGDQFVYPCLLSSLDAVGSGRGYAMLQHCGVVPHFWGSAVKPVSERWPGLDEDDATEDLDDESDDRMDEEEEEEESDDWRGDTRDDKIFPMSPYKRNVEVIKRVVLKHMSDWRHVCSSYYECCSPAFYIGKSEYSGRWYGFVGQRDY
ncbi:hypothetical protein FI667_g5132, partial [Globisporangium splendens]